MDVTAWYIFDGDTRNLKSVAHKKRKEVREAGEAKLASMKEEVEEATKHLFPSPSPSPGLGGLSDLPNVPDPRLSPDVLAEELETPEPVPVPVPVPAPMLETPAWLITVLHAQVDKLEERLRSPSPKLFAAAKEMLGSFAVTAKDDAERHVAVMTASGEVDFSVSADYDTLAFGSPNLVLHFLDMGGPMSVIDMKDVMAALGFDTYAQFVDFCILCGCDMSGKPKGIGPKRAVALIKKYGTIEAMFAKELKSRVDDTFDFAFARQRFFDRSQ
jgi:5'-3' exonuclease